MVINSILIVEDIPENVKKIREWINYFSQIEDFAFSTIYDCSSIMDAEKLLLENEIDVVVLDFYVIGRTYEIDKGSRLIDENHSLFKEKNLKVIIISSLWEQVAYMTSYPGIVYAAIPREERRFQEALLFVAKCIQNERKKSGELHTISLPLKDCSKKTERFYKETEIDITKIAIIEAQKNNTFVFKRTPENIVKKFICSQNLNTIQGLLPEIDFIKVHRSYIVQKNEIDFDLLDSNSEAISIKIEIEKEISIPLGKAFKAQLLEIKTSC